MGTLPFEKIRDILKEEGLLTSDDQPLDVSDAEDKQQITASTTSTSTWISLNLEDVRNGVDIAIDTSGVATLTIQVSTTGDFEGEEFEVRTISYSEAVVNLEQFEFRHQYVRCQVDSNLNDLEMVARGD